MLRYIRISLQRSLSHPTAIPNASKYPIRLISHTSSLGEKQLPPRPKINDADLTVSYLKGTGPGGQKINKTNSAVQLIHKPTGIVVKSQATRSRSQNEKIARRILADKIDELEKGDQSRNAIKVDRARKKKASQLKKSRRKYRALEEGEQGGEEGGEDGEEVQDSKEEGDGGDDADRQGKVQIHQRDGKDSLC